MLDMKRFLLVLLFLVVFGGGGVAWYLLRDSPDKVLLDGARSFMALKSVGSVSVEISSTDLSARTTSGYSIEGQIDAADLTRIRGLGVVRVGAKTQQGQDETLDAVVDSEVIAFRPNTVTPEHRQEYAQHVGSPTSTTFLLFERASFLEKFGYRSLVAKGDSKDVRATLQFLLPTIVAEGALQRTENDGQAIVTSAFRFNRNELRAFLIALIKSWTGKTPTPDEYAWVERTAGGLSRGDWTLSLNRTTRTLTQLTGSFPLIDDNNIEKQRVRFTVDLDGINASVSIVSPGDVVDLTALIRTADLKALPGSQSRLLPPGYVPTQPVVNESQRKQIDLFSKLQEEILRKKKLY